MFVISRSLNEISLNGNEYVLTEDNQIQIFDTPEAAIDFLDKQGITAKQAEAEGIEIIPFEKEKVF